MSVSRINDAVRTRVADKRLTFAEVSEIFAAAREGGGQIDAEELKALTTVLGEYSGKFDQASRLYFKFLLGGAQQQTPAQRVDALFTEAAKNGIISVAEANAFI